MSVQEVDALHRRYVALSHRFRAAWVHHQLVQSLRKVFPDVPGSQHGGDFQLLHTALKEVSEGLGTADPQRVDGRLDQIEVRLSELAGRLVGEDTRVPPERLRQFFQRYQKHDEKILVQLARFYTEAATADGWHPDRLDKIDFLLTRIGQSDADESERYHLSERKHVLEVLRSLWSVTGDGEPDAALRENHLRQVEAIRAELKAVSSLDDLNERGMLDRFRKLKHGLGRLLVEPELGLAVIETNLAFKNLVRRLHRQEERRIVADYQQIFDLEGEARVDGKLEEDLQDFRREIERFETNLQNDGLRLADLARIRGQVKSLLPRLQSAAKPTGEIPVPETGEIDVEDEVSTREVALGTGGAETLVADELAEIENTLVDVPGSISSPARSVCLHPDVFPLRLEPREIVAWRRVREGRDGDGYERFLLEAAALRLRLTRHVREIQELLDETVRSADAPVYQESRRSLKVADRWQRLLEQRIEQHLLEGKPNEARLLMILRMRLLRELSGLWLLAYKPFLLGEEA